MRAKFNVTYAGKNGDFTCEMDDPSVVDGAIMHLVKEALSSGEVIGIEPQQAADLSGFVLDRFPPKEGERDSYLFMVRPGTTFGA